MNASRDPSIMLARLQAVTAAFSGALSPVEVARIAVTQGLEVLGASSSALALLSADGRHLDLVDHEGMQDEAAARFLHVPMTVSAASCDAVRTGLPIYLEDHAAYVASYPDIAPVTAFTDGTKASLPLHVDGRTFGVLGFAFTVWRALDDQERTFMRALASVTAQALERARLFAESVIALREAEAANRLKDDFLATVSHELRTPLNAILGWAAVLSDPLALEVPPKGLDVIERNARSLARLVDDMLDVSRMVRSDLRIERRSVAIVPLVRATIDAAAPAATAKELRLEASFAEDAGDVAGDAARLQQVVWNLVSNAMKFTPRRGAVRVDVTRDSDAVRVVVTDTGIGIAAEFLPHVFERFRQHDSSSTRPHGGLGLGLAVASHLVELHGGTLTVTSPGVGRGATFTMALPGLDGSRSLPPTSPSVSETLDDTLILIADDAPDSRDLITRILEGAGARVIAVGSAREAMVAIAGERPDALVADIGMPGDDGYALVRWIRALAPEAGGDLPAVALTGYASDDDRARTLAAGYAEHIAKPASPADLVRTVARVVRRVPG